MSEPIHPDSVKIRGVKPGSSDSIEVIRLLLEALWEATDPDLIGKLPRGIGKKEDRHKDNCPECGKYHDLPAIHLDYLGHADTTRTIARADLFWNWRPIGGFAEDGEPRFVRDKDGYPRKLWIYLNVLGLERIGVGTVTADKDEPEKELIGDAIRNAAMRFGVGADLWSKTQGDPSEREESSKRSRSRTRTAKAKSSELDTGSEPADATELMNLRLRTRALPTDAKAILSQLWNEKLPNLIDLSAPQLKTATALVVSIEKRAEKGEWGEWQLPADSDTGEVRPQAGDDAGDNPVDASSVENPADLTSEPTIAQETLEAAQAPDPAEDAQGSNAAKRGGNPAEREARPFAPHQESVLAELAIAEVKKWTETEPERITRELLARQLPTTGTLNDQGARLSLALIEERKKAAVT